MTLTLDRIAKLVLPRVAAGEFFAPSERTTFTAAAEVILEGSPVPIAAWEATRNVEKFLLRGGSRRAWRIRVLLAIIEFSPLLLLQGRFSRLSREERTRLIHDRYVHGRSVWALCAKVKHLVYVGAYGCARAEQAVGFIPVPLRSRHFNAARKGASEG